MIDNVIIIIIIIIIILFITAGNCQMWKTFNRRRRMSRVRIGVADGRRKFNTVYCVHLSAL